MKAQRIPKPWDFQSTMHYHPLWMVFQKNCSLEVLLTILAEYEISFIQISVQ